MDCLEKAAASLEVGTWQIFKEIHQAHHYNKKRIEALWAGYITEQFLSPMVMISCDLIVTEQERRNEIRNKGTS